MICKRVSLSLIGLLVSCILTLMLGLGMAIPAFATGCVEDGVTTCSYVLGGGSLSSTRGSVTMSPSTLSGSDQTLTIALPVDVTDQDGLGWAVQVGLTPFSSSSHTLPTTLNVALSGSCDSGSSCSLPDGTTPSPGVSNTLTSTRGTITAAGSLPTAVTVLNTAANGSFFFGMGSMTITTTLTASMLAKNTYAGTYTGIIDVTVVSGPH